MTSWQFYIINKICQTYLNFFLKQNPENNELKVHVSELLTEEINFNNDFIPI